MEFIKFIAVIFAVYCFEVNVSGKRVTNPGIQDNGGQDLGRTLQMVMDQNRKLVAQNDRLQKVWSGLSEMCSAIKSSPCECAATETTTTETATMPSTESSTQPSFLTPPEFPLKIHSVSSTGGDNDSVTVSVQYSAGENHTVQWIGLRTTEAMWRTAGRNSMKMPSGQTLLSSSVNVEQLETMRRLFFYLYNDVEIINVDFNLTELATAQHESMEIPAIRLLDVKPSYHAALDGDLNITTMIDKTEADKNRIYSIDAYFSGVNSSSSLMFEIFNMNSDFLHVDDTLPQNVTISVGLPLIQVGGQLTLRYAQKMTGLIETFYYGPIIKIIPPDSDDVFPANTLGVLPLQKQTFIFSPATSLMCVGLGNPRPNVTLLKVVKNGKLQEVQTETIVSDRYMYMKALTLSTNQRREAEGQYICRASNDNRTVEATTQVIVYEPVVFDDTETKVLRNDSKIVVSCKATGNPVPHLTYTLYDEYGPDLENELTYKRWSEGNAVRVRLKIPASKGTDFHTVYCVARQGEETGTIGRKIDLFPGINKNNNWELYDRLMKT